MNTNKNIDRLFQEKLKDFEVSPPDNVWKGIEGNLQTNNSKTLFPFWLRLGSAAAILILLTIGGVNYFSPENSDINNIIVTDSDNKSAPEINKELFEKDLLNSTKEEESLISGANVDENNISSDKTISNKKQRKDKQEINFKNNTKNAIVSIQPKNGGNKSDNSDAEIVTNRYLKQNTSLLSGNKTKNNFTSDLKNTSINVVVVKDSIERNIENNYSSLSLSDRIMQKNAKEIDLNNFKYTSDEVKVSHEKDSDKVKSVVADTESKEDKTFEDVVAEDFEKDTEENIKRWSVATVFAPTFYNSFNTKGSPLDLQFKNNPKQGSKTMSYGVKVGYRINKKLSFQSGMTLVNVGYKIGDVFVSPSQETLQGLVNVKYSNVTNILDVSPQNALNELRSETTSLISVKGVLNQQFGYIEVPLELKYKLNNSQKLGINLVGGFSTLFLNKNEVFVETTEFSSNLGVAKNLNSVNFSGNLGIDVDYKINKNFYFNVAPMLKMHTSTFSKDTDNFKPYTIGVYTGLNYKF